MSTRQLCPPPPICKKTQVRNELCALKGVGPKVADCVALFSLDQVQANP